ncbi:hypothetical protein INT48_001299 [Thamnidium elegans]|uniref:Uncharacterized protein n=1 Tax=Thamnidium elegans TaxID=101142 RepID=A0A8H7VTK4_9FUNG|nr:hypothetical protein INT48_001299 [Thamnidium elegans]
MNVSAIFSLFCGNNTGDGMKNLDMYGFDDEVFLSRQQANEQKDAVFSSFFGIFEITNTAYSFNQKFNHIITFLPGLKTVRVSGTLIRNTSSNSSESNALELQLKNAVQTRTNRIITSDIKVNDKLYKKIEHHKLLTKRHNNEVMIIRENLKATKSRIYDLQKQLNFPEYGKDFTKKDEQNIVKKFEKTKGNYKCFERTEDIELDEQVRYSENLLFSGTDNGLVTMTETARLDIKQVKFHLKPYNKYSILNDIKEGDQDAELNFSDDEINQATLCKTLRQFISSKQNKHPIMLTGDRGYCHGSGIKGHLKYGGVWKPKLHSLYTSV